MVSKVRVAIVKIRGIIVLFLVVQPPTVIRLLILTDVGGNLTVVL